jgi:hypothetical protein
VAAMLVARRKLPAFFTTGTLPALPAGHPAADHPADGHPAAVHPAADRPAAPHLAPVLDPA